MRYNQHKWAINNSPVLNLLTSLQAERMTNEIDIRLMKTGEVVFEKDEACSKLVFMTENSLVDAEGKLHAERGSVFGDKYLLLANAKAKIEEALVCGGDGVVGFIPFATVRKQLAKPL